MAQRASPPVLFASGGNIINPLLVLHLANPFVSGGAKASISGCVKSKEAQKQPANLEGQESRVMRAGQQLPAFELNTAEMILFFR